MIADKYRELNGWEWKVTIEVADLIEACEHPSKWRLGSITDALAALREKMEEL